MQPEEFNKEVEKRLDKIKDLFLKKGAEYSTTEDKFHNFKSAGRLNNEHPCRALHGMLTKHLVSYFDILKKLESNEKIDLPLIEEKMGDIIAYFILQEILIYDVLNKVL